MSEVLNADIAPPDAVACLFLARLYRQQFKGAGFGQRTPV
jgi:hypothetical protein